MDTTWRVRLPRSPISRKPEREISMNMTVLSNLRGGEGKNQKGGGGEGGKNKGKLCLEHEYPAPQTAHVAVSSVVPADPIPGNVPIYKAPRPTLHTQTIYYPAFPRTRKTNHRPQAPLFVLSRPHSTRPPAFNIDSRPKTGHKRTMSHQNRSKIAGHPLS